MRFEPNQITATLDKFVMSMTLGIISAIRRPAVSEVAVSSPFVASKRSVSSGSRTKARTTRTPVICSRSTRFTPSMRSCITRNVGTMREMIEPTTSRRAGMLTSRITDSPTSSRSARTVPPIAVIGAAMSNVQVMKTIICTCWTSFVIRVISEGAPNWFTSRLENPVTL